MLNFLKPIVVETLNFEYQFNGSKESHSQSFHVLAGSRKKSPGKKPPDSKPNPIPNLILTLPLTPHGGLFSEGIFF